MLGLSANASIDFGVLFNIGPNPYVILSPDFTIMGMNEAYLQATMRQRADIVGRNMFDAFPGTPDEKGRANVAQLKASLNRVLESSQSDRRAKRADA